MAQAAVTMDACGTEREAHPTLSGETRHQIGTALRRVYAKMLDPQPIPDAQVDLLLRLRHKERDLRRLG